MTLFRLFAALWLFTCAPASAATFLFTCAIGAKDVTVARVGDAFTYSYGPGGAPELEITRNAAEVSHGYIAYIRGEDRWLRIRNGAYSYIVFNRWSAPESDGVGGGERSGLLVLRDAEVIALKPCADAAAFDLATDLDALPAEDRAVAELFPEIQPRAGSGYLDELETAEGRLLSAEDAPYPLFVLDLERDGGVETFLLNAEDLGMSPATLAAFVGQQVRLYLRPVEELFVLSVEADGDVVIAPFGDADPDAEAVSGTLIGADAVTESDLPGEFYVETADGDVLGFPYYIPPELVAVNGAEATVRFMRRSTDYVYEIEPVE